nr:unnamed protein product [Digitaria exilis]
MKNNVYKVDEDMDEQGTLCFERGKLKNRARTFTGAFVGIVSPVLLAIVLKKTTLKNIGNYQGTRMLENSIDFIEVIFPVLAAVTLPIGIMPFLCVMISEACAILPDCVVYLPERLLKASKVVVFLSNILLIFLGSGVLVFIHRNACFGWRGDSNAGCSEEYHTELEHSLEFSAGITAMMFLVLGSVVLEGLLKSTQLSQPTAPAPSEGPTIREPGTFLAATLFVSFLTSAIAASLMNVWTIPLAVLTGSHVRGLNITLATLAALVVFLIAWEGLELVAWLTLLLPVILLLMLLLIKSCNRVDDSSTPQGEEKGNEKKEEKELEAGPQPPGGQTQQQDEETKPAPLELTKVTLTGLLAVAVPGITSASPGIANKLCVFFAASTIPLGILWRLLTTHDNAPSPAVRRAASLSSFFAHAFFFCAGITFGVIAVNVPS